MISLKTQITGHKWNSVYDVYFFLLLLFSEYVLVYKKV